MRRQLVRRRIAARVEVFVWYSAAKRLFDLVLASLGLALFLPVGAVIAALIKLSDRGPIFYGQVRVGQFGKPFRIWKFRSMIVNAERLGAHVTSGDDSRITQVGRWLRRTKLDELPQLWNVFMGQMSFVGPRPEVPRYVERYTPAQREILRYKPGITDLASMLFRHEEALLSGCQDVEDFYVRYCLPKKIALNQQHAEQASLWRDILVILRTLWLLAPVPGFRKTLPGPARPALVKAETELPPKPARSRLAIVGTDRTATELAERLSTDPAAGGRLVALFGDDPWAWHKSVSGVQVVGMPECLLQPQWQAQIDEVIIALPTAETARRRELGAIFKDLPLTVSYARPSRC